MGCLGSHWDNHGLLTLICFHGDRKAISAITEIRVLSAFVLFGNGSRRLSKCLLLATRLRTQLPRPPRSSVLLVSPPTEKPTYCLDFWTCVCVCLCVNGKAELNNILKRKKKNEQRYGVMYLLLKKQQRKYENMAEECC